MFSSKINYCEKKNKKRQTITANVICCREGKGSVKPHHKSERERATERAKSATNLFGREQRTQHRAIIGIRRSQAIKSQQTVRELERESPRPNPRERHITNTHME